MGNGLAGEQADVGIVSALGEVVADLELVFASAESLAVFAEKSSDSERKILVRKVWSSVRQVSPGSVDLSELMLWVATIGMHLGWRERLKNFSSPVGSLSPTVAKCWYSSQRKRTWRKYCSGWASISGMRFKHGTLEIELHHYAQGLGKTRVHPDGKVQRTDGPGLDQPAERRQRLAVTDSRHWLLGS